MGVIEINRFANLVSFYFKQFFTSKLYIGTLLFFSITFLLRIYFRITDTFGMSDYGNLIGEMFIIVHVLFLTHMVYFYKFLTDELTYGVQNFFPDSYVIMVQKIVAITMVHLVIQLFFYTIQFGILMIFYRVVSIPVSHFYLESYVFILFYYFIPTIIAMGLGIIIAILIGKHKISFGIIFIIWLFLGPLNTTIFPWHFRSLGVNDLENLLYLSVQSIQNIYKSYIGFDFSVATIWKSISWLLLLVFLIGTLTLRWCTIPKERTKTLLVLMSCLAFFIVSSFMMMESGSKAFQFSHQEEEIDYYERSYEFQTDLNYTIKQYTIEFAREMSVEIDFNSLDTRTPTFQLYHAYPILKITDSAGKELKYERNGDQVRVYVEKTTALKFIYQLTDSYFQPFYRKKFILSADMGWYPRKLANQVYEYDQRNDALVRNHFSTESTAFTLTIENDQNPILNLSQESPGKYKGIVDGVSIIQGTNLTVTFDDYKLIYPADGGEDKKQFEIFVEKLELVHEQLSNISTLEVPKLPKQIVIFSGQGETSQSTNLLMYNTDSLYPLDSIYTLYLVPEKVIRAFLIQSRTNTPLEFSAMNEWTNLAADTLATRNDLSQEEGFNPLPDSYYALSKKEQHQAEKIYSDFFGLTVELQNVFLKQWYEEIETIQNDWTQIEQLMEEVVTLEN